MQGVAKNELRFYKVFSILQAGGEGDGEGNVKGMVSPAEVVNYMVTFEREMDSFPILGPGGKIRVYLARNGEVIGHSKLWRTYQKDKKEAKTKKMKALSPGNAHKKMSDLINEQTTDETTAEFKSMKFGYFENGRHKRQNYSIPVYEFIYSYGPHSKRVLRYLDGYSGELISRAEEYLKGDIK
jgi:hypothetical protein